MQIPSAAPALLSEPQGWHLGIRNEGTLECLVGVRPREGK